MGRYVIRSSRNKNSSKKENEDWKSVDYKRNIALLADGVSESGYGLHAAFRAVNEAEFQITAIVDALHKGQLPKEELLEYIVDCGFMLTNDSMIGTTMKIKEFSEWSSTLDCCVIYDNTAYIAHVGDSRVYHITKRCKSIKQLTKDHSTPKFGLEEIEPKYRRLACLDTKLTNSMSREGLQVDTMTQELKRGDIILMVSDGYTKAMDDKELLTVCRDSNFETELRKNLPEYARKREDSTRLYSELKGIELKKAYNALDDDRTFIAIRRMK